ncbi:MAG: hypothetical protein GX575_00135 [Candidatus Anammoximicrobium sp.]|nr:hypothetical protein [Candidatus Anammoximicrobium sp.]
MKSRAEATELNLDSLMDTVTNVVGILVLILVMVTLNIKKAVDRIREEDPSQFGVTEAMLAEIQQQAQDQQVTIQELKIRAFGLDAQLEQDRTEIREQQRQVEELRRIVPPDKPKADLLKEVRKQVEERKKKQEQLQEQLAKIDAELDAVRGELGQTPEMAPKAPKIARLPNPRDAPKGAKPVLFICREGRLMFFDPEDLRERVQKRVQFLLRSLLAKAGPGGEIDCEKLVESYNKDALSDQEFRSRLVVENFNLVLIYEYKGAGESPDRLRNPASRFQSVIRRLDPQKNYARFLVWPDSFDVYVEARTICDERGVLAGWEPYSESYQWKVSLGITVACRGKPKPPPKPAPSKTDPRKPAVPPPPLPSDAVD